MSRCSQRLQTNEQTNLPGQVPRAQPREALRPGTASGALKIVPSAAHCTPGEEYEVELALREALSNGIVHGNRLDAHKLVRVRCRCKAGDGISVIVSDQGQGFDARTVSEPVSAEDLEAEDRRGIHLMKLAMDQVSFEQKGTEVHMSKRPTRDARVDMQSDSQSS